jgi:hypothetical protein
VADAKFISQTIQEKTMQTNNEDRNVLEAEHGDASTSINNMLIDIQDKAYSRGYQRGALDTIKGRVTVEITKSEMAQLKEVASDSVLPNCNTHILLKTPEVIATDKNQGWCPDVCPLTGAPFFMWIEHYKTGQMVPTYGGPLDSYTIPVKHSDGSYYRERYDHDLGGWLIDESEDIGLVVVAEADFEPKKQPKNTTTTDCVADELLCLSYALYRQKMTGLEISLVNRSLFQPVMNSMYAIDPVKTSRFLANIKIEKGQGIA